MMKKSLFLLGLTIALTGCGRKLELTNFENLWLKGHHGQIRARQVMREDFSVDLVRFDDSRRPRSLKQDYHDDVIYEYAPDKLVSGVKHRVPVLISKHLNYGKRKEKNYLLEVEMEKIRTSIKTGTFSTGRFGRYVVKVELRAIVRKPDSTVVMNDDFSYELEERRDSYNGRPPSAEMDREKMFELFDEAIRNITLDMAWKLRRIDNRG